VTEPVRVVIDTNVVISAIVFRTGRLAWIRQALGTSLIPAVSTETLAELVRVLAYPRFGLSIEQQKIALTFYMEYAETYPEPRPRNKLPKCRDPKDEMFLRLAYATKVDAIITGDDDLLALASESQVSILSPIELVAHIKKKR
jgi:uncharacterized protein